LAVLAPALAAPAWVAPWVCQVLSGGSSGRHHQHLRVRRLFNGLFDGRVERLRERKNKNLPDEMKLNKSRVFYNSEGMLDFETPSRKHKKNSTIAEQDYKHSDYQLQK
jgi:hypothetical protein